MELTKTYDPKLVEDKWYSIWTDKKLLSTDASRGGTPYTIVMPPPNVTGILHMGHALNVTIQDILIRWKRMQGFNALWLPGTDHAGIATQNVVEKALKKSGIKEGMVLVSAMHITAGVYVNDAESGLIQDIDEWLEKLAPYNPHYRHHRTGEDNGDAHLKSLLIHHEVIIPVTEGNLDFGPWQQVYYAEFDGQRRKRVIIKIIGE